MQLEAELCLIEYSLLKLSFLVKTNQKLQYVGFAMFVVVINVLN